MSTEQLYGNALDEWKEARSMFARFDNNLHDLRKYGFSFVTALLAANSLVGISGTPSIPDEVKASILVVTMGLIVTLKVLDKHYLGFEKAASLRCRLLEDRLNLELTGDIAYFYDLGYWWIAIMLLYLGFVWLTAILGYAILTYAVVLNQLLFNWILIAMVIFSGLIIAIDVGTFVKGYYRDLQDWTVDLKIVSKGTPLRITFTNLNKSEDKSPENYTLWWWVKPLQGEHQTAGNGPPGGVVLKNLGYFENYVWLWETADDKTKRPEDQVKPGLYEFEMFSSKGDVRNEIMKNNNANVENIKNEFQRIMTQNDDAPCKWIIQVTSASKEEEHLTDFLIRLSHK